MPIVYYFINKSIYLKKKLLDYPNIRAIHYTYISFYKMKSFHTDSDNLFGKPERAFIHYENVRVSFIEESDGPTFFLLDSTSRKNFIKSRLSSRIQRMNK